MHVGPSVRATWVEMFDSQLRSAVCHITNSRQWSVASGFLPVKAGGLGVRWIASLAIPTFLTSAASTLSLQASIFTGCSGSPECHFLWHTCWIGRPGLAHSLINFLPNRHSGIAPSSHLTAPKFSPALIVPFNWLPFWLQPPVIMETD